MMHPRNVNSSFRDPSGHVFTDKGIIYRQINKCYKENYDHLMQSGLYTTLVKNQCLIPHTEIEELQNFSKLKDSTLERENERLLFQSSLESTPQHYKTIQPRKIPFISYPYEWCFGQLKAAALLTLDIQKTSLEYGMSLKDASAYNIQFLRGHPIHIDTLSFEMQKKDMPWIAYRQFCEIFLAPLMLMHFKDVRLNQLLKIYIDGVPLDLTSKLLPSSTWFNFAVLIHIHLHSRSIQHFLNRKADVKKFRMPKLSLRGLLNSLENLIRKLRWIPLGTAWGEYYSHTNYSEVSMNHKVEIISEFIKETQPRTVWDLGANAGFFSRIVSQSNIETISFDFDPVAVEKNYQNCIQEQESHILPIMLDLMNPSPSIGWQNKERLSILERGPADMVMALALVHHLAIYHNIPLRKIADFFAHLCNLLIIEFVPKSDSQLQGMLTNREDIYHSYTQTGFEEEMRCHFKIISFIPIKHSRRILYLMKRR